MATAESPGFCNHECEIDQYVSSADELSIMGRVAEIEPELNDQQTRLKEVMSTVGVYQAGIVEACKEEAKTRPCEGYLEEGVRSGFLPPGLTTHCPLIIRHFAGMVE